MGFGLDQWPLNWGHIYFSYFKWWYAAGWSLAVFLLFWVFMALSRNRWWSPWLGVGIILGVFATWWPLIYICAYLICLYWWGMLPRSYAMPRGIKKETHSLVQTYEEIDHEIFQQEWDTWVMNGGDPNAVPPEFQRQEWFDVVEAPQ